MQASTWLRARYPDAAWIDLLDAKTERTYYTRPERLTEFLKAHAGRRPVVIDEIQRVPELLPLVHPPRAPLRTAHRGAAKQARPGARWRRSGVGGLEGGEVAGGAAELDADEVDRLAAGAVLVGVAALLELVDVAPMLVRMMARSAWPTWRASAWCSDSAASRSRNRRCLTPHLTSPRRRRRRREVTRKRSDACRGCGQAARWRRASQGLSSSRRYLRRGPRFVLRPSCMTMLSLRVQEADAQAATRRAAAEGMRTVLRGR